MSRNTIPLDYANSLIYELQKAFWDERGRGARFRMTKVGREFFQEKCLPLLQSPDLDEVLNTVKGVLRAEGITADLSFNYEDRLLRVEVAGCLHRQAEERMVAHGIEPFTCVPANLIALAIEEKLDRPVELAEIKLEEGTCRLLLVVFDRRPVLG